MKRDFRVFWAGQVTSAFGSAFTTVALPLVAVRWLDASPAQMGLLVAIASLPLLLFGLLIATWIDRLPRRRPLLVGCDLVAAATLASLFAGCAAGRLTLVVLAVAVFVLGLVGVTAESAYFVHLRSLVRDEHVVHARARLQGGEQAAAVLARVLAGPTAAVSAALPFALDCLSCVVSAVSLLLIRESEPRRRPTAGGPPDWREVAAGLTVLYREGFFRRMTPFFVGQQLVAGVTLALSAPFLLKVLEIPTWGYGSVFVFLGVASVTGSTVAARLAHRVDPRRLAVLAYLGAAMATMLLPFAGGAMPIAIVLAALGIGLPYFFGAIANVGLTGFITVTVEEQKLGRAGVGLQVVSAAALVAGSLGGGLAAAQIGVRSTLWLAATLSAVTLIVLRPLLRTHGRQLPEKSAIGPPRPRGTLT